MKRIAVLGSTGSIGRNTLEIVDQFQERFQVTALAAGDNVRLLLEQSRKYKPKLVSLRRKEEAEFFRRELKDLPIEVTFGRQGAEDVAGSGESDIVVSAITGIEGLKPTMAAVRSGKMLALANKESMVVAGPLIRDEAQKRGASIIPVDSEHSGVFQCLAKEKKENVKKVFLTASGGPFLNANPGDIRNKSLEEALNHPTWKMGKKVTIDSATMMNKGLELIEARWLFDLEPGQLDILIHPQSIVHSLVEMRDSSVLAQLSPTDMKVPIQFALFYPERENAFLPSLDLAKVHRLEFFDVDMRQYPLVKVARQVLQEGESFPIALNAANEVTVENFIKRRISFSDILDVVTEIVGRHRKRPVGRIEDVFEVDNETREMTWKLLQERY